MVKWTVLLALVLTGGCNASENEDCGKPEDCEFGLICDVPTAKCVTPAMVVARDECRTSTACQRYGRCGANSHGQCVVTGKGCHASDVCQKYGWCAVGPQGECVLAEEDCRALDVCRDPGACVAGPKGKCVVSDRSCRASEVCQKYGTCTADLHGRCVATDEGCRASGGCQKYGACRADLLHGRCVATDEGCRASGGCQKYGLCRAGRNGKCVATNEGCRASNVCRAPGACVAGPEGKCVATDEADRSHKNARRTLGLQRRRPKPSFRVVNEKRVDVGASVPRLVVRIAVPRGLPRETIAATIERAARAAYARQLRAGTRLGAVMVFAYCDGDDYHGSYTAGSAEYAPSGKWENADPGVPLSRWKATMRIPRGYFKKREALLAPSTKVRLIPKVSEPDGTVLITDDPGSWGDDHEVVSVPSGTRGKVLRCKSTAITADITLYRCEVRVKHNRRTYRGWVHMMDLRPIH